MYRHRVVLVLGLLCTFVAQTAHAFFDPPWVTQRRRELVRSCRSIFAAGDATLFLSGPVIRRLRDRAMIVDFAYYDLLGPTTINLGVIPFTVTGATGAASVPAAGTPSLFALFLFVSGLALRVLQASRRSR